jgi:hypothetical protein
MKSINELFRLVILVNELDNNTKLAFTFSDPDGVRSGKSGWSFGVCQFDTRNNNQALACLAECGFNSGEIHGVVDQTIDVRPFAARLKEYSDIIAKYDEAQLSRCIFSAMDFYARHSIPVTDTGAILASADYVNQYGSQGDGFAAYMKSLGRPVVANDILKFKLEHTVYGKRCPKDCQRRFDNLVDILDREGIEYGRG